MEKFEVSLPTYASVDLFLDIEAESEEVAIEEFRERARNSKWAGFNIRLREEPEPLDFSSNRLLVSEAPHDTDTRKGLDELHWKLISALQSAEEILRARGEESMELLQITRSIQSAIHSEISR